MAQSLLTRTLILAAACLATSAVFADTARNYFEDGNRLFRDDLYWAALLRYQQALDAGLGTPRLHYNMGVTHYRAGQYRRARASLEKAAQSPQLAPLAHYNLGLNAWRAGNNDDAMRFLRRARTQNQNNQVARLARRAMARLETVEEVEEAVSERAPRRPPPERRSTKFDIRAKVGFGNNDNVYRSPSSDYVDLANPAQPVVTPQVTSGAFLPVELTLRYNLNSTEFENFYVAYRAKGDYYQDKELDTANEFVQEISFGNSFIRKRDDGVRTTVFSAFKIGQHIETFFDPDDGAERDIDGVGIGDRFNFLRYGPELRIRRAGERLALGFKFRGQLRNYEDVELVPEYDHEFLSAGLHGQYKFTSTSLIRFDVEAMARRYGDRPSFDLDGRQRIGNPGVEYSYLVASVTARQRITRNAWFGVEYERTDRTDRYVGYNDYLRDSFGFEARWRPSDRFSIEANARYSLYDFPNAFAFNNDQLSRKTLESAIGSVEAEWRLTRRLSLVGELEHRETVSNDSRIQFDQNRFLLSVSWEQ
ncbi:MAG: tetratricopeptide repeat protein [Pseudomonadota bacterium]